MNFKSLPKMIKVIAILGLLSFVDETAADYSDRVCKILNYACGGGSGSTNTGKSYPSSKDSVGNNPASIPTDKTPFGVEMLWGDKQLDYSFFQGYGKFGMAVGSITKENAYFSNASNLAASGISLAEGTGEDINKPNFQAGIAIPIFKNTFKRYLVPYIGGGARRYRVSRHIRETYGLSFANSFIHFGSGFSKNDKNIGILSLSGGFSFGILSLDYSHIRNMRGVTNETQIYSAVATLKKFTFIGAWRKQKLQTLTDEDIRLIQLQEKHYSSIHLFGGIQYQIGKILSIGYYINYVLERGGYIGARLTIGSY